MTGHNSIKMTDLSSLYISLGFTDAITFIQSGNVIFSNKDKETESSISTKIEKGILEKFNYIVPVMIRTNQELSDLFSVNPFLGEIKFDPAKMAFIFLHEEPSAELNYIPTSLKRKWVLQELPGTERQ